MLVRVVRTVSGTLLLLVGIPLLLAGGGLWFAMQHQDPTGGYAATLSTVTSDGHAVVTSDVDGLLRQEVPFARGGRTTVELTATTPEGPAFLGLAPAEAVAGYLADVPYTQVDEVRLARGPLPVVTTEVAGEEEPATPPQQQSFWLASGHAGTLSWAAEDLRGQQVALVVMDPDGEAPLTVELAARVHPHWLGSTMVGLLLLGTLLTLIAVALLAWPHRSRQVVYVVPPTEVSQVAAQLGVPVPRTEPASEAGSGSASGPGPVGGPESDRVAGGVALGQVVTWIPVPGGAVAGGPEDPGGDPEPIPGEEDPGEEPSLDTLPITDRESAPAGAPEPELAPLGGDGDPTEGEPVEDDPTTAATGVMAAAVDAAEPAPDDAGAGDTADGADREEDPASGERAGADPRDAAPEHEESEQDGAGAPELVTLTGTDPGVPVPVDVWEWPPVAQQPTAPPSPARRG